MSEQRYRTLHAPATAEDLMDENEWKYQQLLKRMGVLERETKLQAQRSEQKIAELNRRNQSLTERNERNEQQSARRIEELERKNRELAEQNEKISRQSAKTADAAGQGEEPVTTESGIRGNAVTTSVEPDRDDNRLYGQADRNEEVKNKRDWMPIAFFLILLIVGIGQGWGIWQLAGNAEDNTAVSRNTASTQAETAGTQKETAGKDTNTVGTGKENVMKSYFDEESVWGNSSLNKSDIYTITFLNTMSQVPDDAWDVSEAGDGSVMAWVESNGKGYDLYAAGDGGVAVDDSCFDGFYYFDSVKNIFFDGNFDTSNLEWMSFMFSGCSSLTTLDVSGFDTSNVTDMDSMFYGCSNLTTLDVSGFDTSNVTNMEYMFYGCSNLTTLDVSGFDTSNVTDMCNMFGYCNSLTTLDVSGFDTSNVTNMASMFSNCSSLTILDVSGFNTSNVTDMWFMFSDCSSLTTLDVSGFNTSSVTDMEYMFWGCSSLTVLDISGFDTSNADTTDMTYGCSNVIQ